MSWLRTFFKSLKDKRKQEPKTIRRGGFFPVQDWKKGKNFRHQFFIQRDGTSIEAIFLTITDKRLREEIISRHYCKNFSRLFFTGALGETPEFFVLSRDDPWDFEIVLGGSRVFNIEITAISSMQFFRMMSLEQNLFSRISQSHIYGRDALKLEAQFPSVFPENFIAEIKSKNSNKARKFKIPAGVDRSMIMVGEVPSFKLNVEKELFAAIKKKEAKRHSGKNQTVLIIDNLTMTTEPIEFFEAREALAAVLANTPFEEVWVYTGFYSDTDGGNAEYSFLPLKISPEMEATLLGEAERSPSGTDEFGRLIL